MMNSMYKLQKNEKKMGWHFCLIKENGRGNRKKQEFRYWLQVFWFKISQQSKVTMSKYQLNPLRWKAERKWRPVFSISDIRFCPQISFGGLRGDRWEEYVITWYCWYGFLSSRSLLWLNNDLHTKRVWLAYVKFVLACPHVCLPIHYYSFMGNQINETSLNYTEHQLINIH